jgi:hypothetical protein
MIYDKTGHNSLFKCSEEFVVFKADQRYKLTKPAYYEVPKEGWDGPEVDVEHSLRAWRIDPDSGAETKLTIITNREGDDAYEALACQTDEADQVKAEMLAVSGIEKGYDPTFVTTIQIGLFDEYGTINKPFRVRLEYQTPKRENQQVVEDYDGTGPKYSPSMMKNVLGRIDRLEQRTGFGSKFGTALSNSSILDEDLTGVAPENYVRYERHDLNVAAGVNLIQPLRGPFFGHDVAVYSFREVAYTLNDYTIENEIETNGQYLFTYTDTSKITESNIHLATEYRVILNGKADARAFLNELNVSVITGRIVDLTSDNFVELTNSVDYVLDTVDIGRTGRALHTSGVYKNIRFITARAGLNVMVCYHAFGGVATATDMRTINQEIKNVREVIADTGLVTEHTLGNTEYLKMINKRLTRIEEFHSHFGQVEHRVSTKIPGFHWFNVAAIYDDNWGKVLGVLSEIGQFRISSALRGWSYEFIVDVDLRRQPEDILKIKTLATNQFNGNSNGSFSKFLNQDTVACRLCWINDGSSSGIVLQIGWDFECYQTETYPVDTDTLIVTNRSGSASSWHLLSDPNQVGYVADSLINVYMHQTFQLTTDKVVNGNKKYYRYNDVYRYTPTIDLVVQPGKTYYYLTVEDNFEGVPVYNYQPIPANIATIDRSIADVKHRIGSEIYERLFTGHQVSEVTDMEPGDDITEDLYEVTAGSYGEDNSFTMPGGSSNLVWRVGTSGCNSSVKIIPTDDGIIAWQGNLDLTPYAPEYEDCVKCQDMDYEASDGDTVVKSLPKLSVCIDKDIQNELDVKSIKNISLMVFDRITGTYQMKSAPAFVNNTGSKSEVCIDAEDMCYVECGIDTVEATDDFYGTSYQKDIVGGVETGKYEFSTKQVNEEGSTKKYIEISIEAFLGSYSLINKRFDLRQVRFHF